MKRAALIACLLFSLVPFAHAQKLESAATLPAAQTRVEIAEFESPDQSALGYVVARLIARDILRDNPGIGGVHVAVPPTADQRVSKNPEYLETLSMQNHASIVIWGEYYVEGDTVVIRPYLRLTPQSPMTEESYGLRLTTVEGPINAAPPTTQIDFTPFLASRKALEEMQAAFLASRMLREEPNAAARVMTPSPAIAADTKPTMWLLELRGDWIKVRLHDNTTGWIEASNRPSPLKSGGVTTVCMGAALFIMGRYADADKVLTTYLSQQAAEENTMNRAFAHTMLGSSRLRTMQNTVPLPENESASQEFLKAKELLPDSPSPGDHLAVTRLMKHLPDSTGVYPTPVGAFGDSEGDLIEAVQKDKNSQSIENLRTFYRLAERQKFLKDTEMDERTYKEGLHERIEIVAKVEEEERMLREGRTIEIVVGVQRIFTNLMSFSAGLWLPKDAEKNLTFRDLNFDESNAVIKQSQAYGGEIHFRGKMSFPLYFDFAASGWYSTYDLTPKTVDATPADTVRSANAWVLIAPAQFGLSLTLFSGLPVEPYINAGAGVAFGISSLNVETRASEINEDEKTDVRFAWYLGAGADVFLGRDVAITVSAKYQVLSFKEAMWTGQTDFSGVQLLAGLTYRL
jgi:hypothetical protein